MPGLLHGLACSRPARIDRVLSSCCCAGGLQERQGQANGPFNHGSGGAARGLVGEPSRLESLEPAPHVGSRGNHSTIVPHRRAGQIDPPFLRPRGNLRFPVTLVPHPRHLHPRLRNEQLLVKPHRIPVGHAGEKILSSHVDAFGCNRTGVEELFRSLPDLFPKPA